MPNSLFISLALRGLRLYSRGFNRRPHQPALETPYKKLQALQNINFTIYYYNYIGYSELT
ncbi:hypothetical protein CP500_013825 [Tychonema bourrellyi FEM_GT703]|uniref:Uncharacterized protein n=1 Tax=Tychonema bourrellyi FEM_GT703 TaxID=2040638 RepID=A0A2G4EZB4_9CYAN|nr:hypothetical protein CP500_013825 [Tychonema bourrellyi FEM_GT703]